MSSNLDLSAIADALAPLIVHRVKAILRESVPAQAEALAVAAAEVPGLDALSVAALADWMEERGYDTQAGRLRRMPVEDGDILILKHEHRLPTEGRAAMDRHAERLKRLLAETGRRVAIVCLDGPVSLYALPRRG